MMTMIQKTVIFTLIPVLASLVAVSARPKSMQALDSWLDRSLVNWNRPGSSLPRAPAGERSELSGQCRHQVRQPATPEERAAVRLGWTLFGPSQSYGATSVFTAMAGIDGMCRPMGYQAFVYVGGRYAGTLSPAPMDSRSDASLTRIYLINSTSVAAEFARYTESDPFCCPSKTSSANYRVRTTGNPNVTAVEVTTQVPCPVDEPPADDNANQATALFGKRWTLTGIGEQRLSAGKPYVEFDEQQRRVSGDGGCNRFSGGFELNGQSLKLTRLISTKRACLAPEANRLETSFLQALEQITRFDVRGNTLLFYAGDRQLLSFTSQ